MKELIVSFEISTTQCSLDELSSKIGLQYASGSFDKGKIYREKVSQNTIWKIFSTTDKFASLEEHCRSLFDILSKVDILRSGLLPEDCQFTLNIGILFSSDNITCSISISKICLEMMKDYKLNIEVSCYPCVE